MFLLIFMLTDASMFDETSVSLTIQGYHHLTITL